MNKRIMIFNFVPYYGGADRCIIELAEYFKKNIVVVTPDISSEKYIEELETLGINHHKLSNLRAKDILGKGPFRYIKSIINFLKYFSYSRKLIKIYKEENCDLICTHNIKSAFVILLNRKLRKEKLCLYLHGWYKPKQLGWIGKKISKRENTNILAVSNGTKNALLCSGIKHSKIKVIHNPVHSYYIEKAINLGPIKPLPKSSKIKILIPAGIMFNKGQHTAIIAMNELIMNEVLNYELWLCGEDYGFEKGNKYFSQLYQYISDHKLREYVKFIGFREDIYAVMDQSDIILLPSYTEGLPRIILEAMALGKIVISTPVGGVMDLIVDNITGILFDINDSTSLADILMNLNLKAPACSLIRENALNIARSHEPNKIFKQIGDYIQNQ